MKEFDLFKFIIISTIVAITFVLLFQIDYSSIGSWKEFLAWTEEPFEWKNGHYLLVLVAIVTYGR